MLTRDVRVLVVEELSRRSELTRQLTVEPLTVVGGAGFGPEAINVAEEVKPDVVVLSLEDPFVRALRTAEALAAAHPQVPIVVAASRVGPEEMRQAMRVGARDYLIKPIRHAEQIGAIVSLVEAQARRGAGTPGGAHRGEVIAIFSPKGGVGKTTIAVNLAVSLAQATNQRVALLDFDTQLGDVGLWLDLPQDRSIVDAGDQYERLDADLLETLMYTDPSGIRVLPAAQSPEDADRLSVGAVERIIDVAAQTYDYVVLDTSPSLTEVAGALLNRSATIMLITGPELATLKRARLTLTLMRQSWRTLKDRVRIIVNYPYGGDPLTPAEIEETLEYPVFWQVPYDATVPDALKRGRPCLEIQPNGVFARNILSLARAVSGSEASATKQSSVVGRMVPWLRANLLGLF
ncbi:MAG: AAA family ATPase [Chloroflexi bacterium]|nr:AAA family ATPase [Chloroflexota bacterium]